MKATAPLFRPMKPDTIAAIESEKAEFPDAYSEPISQSEIFDAAKKLERGFPDDLVEFLARYGGGGVGPYPIFGLRRPKQMGEPHSIIAVNLEFRTKCPWEAAGWLIFSMDHAGNYVGIGEDGRVYTWDHNFGGKVQLATSFEDYLRRECLELGS